MKKISVIVPVYNSEKYLEKCVESLINQSLKDIEIIIINDGSTDNSHSIIKKYNDSRIIYIKNNNQGIGKTRNQGILLSKSKYIAFLDSDDYLEREFCEKMYNNAIKNNSDVVVCDYNEIGTSKEIKRVANFKLANLKENPSLINNINLGPCNKIYRTSLLKENNILFEEKLKYEDAPFVVKAIVLSNKISKCNEPLTNYVIHNNSETTIRDKKIFDILEIVKIIDEFLTNQKYSRDCIVSLIVMILTDYTIQQRYIKNKKDRDKFIDMAFDYLNNLDKNWKKCDYLKKFSFIKRLVKRSKFLTKIYTKWYSLI